MYNITCIDFVTFLAIAQPFVQISNVFVLSPNLEIISLNNKYYSYKKEPPIEGYSFVASVNKSFNKFLEDFHNNLYCFS